MTNDEPFDDRRDLAGFLASRSGKQEDAIYLMLGYRCIKTGDVNACIELRDTTYHVDREQLETVAPDEFVEKTVAMVQLQDDMVLD